MRVLSSPQGVVTITAFAFALILALSNPAFFSTATLVDLARNSLVTGIFAIGVVMVLASGGIDVSFTAIGAFAMYATIKLLTVYGINIPIAGIFAIGALIGAALGLINGLLIGGLGLPTLIVTLGTLSLFRGALLTFLGTVYITTVPREIITFSRTVLVRVENAAGQIVSLPFSYLVLVGVALLAAILMNGTMFGRKIYAIGGSEEAATRIGINVPRVKVMIYVISGAIAGLAGITQVTLARMANPCRHGAQRHCRSRAGRRTDHGRTRHYCRDAHWRVRHHNDQHVAPNGRRAILLAKGRGRHSDRPRHWTADRNRPLCAPS
jgi:simple sugar transport system permease protein